MDLRTIEEIRKVELNFIAKDKDGNEKEITITPEYRIPSMAVQDAMLKIREKLLTALEKLDVDYQDLKDVDYETVLKDPPLYRRMLTKQVAITTEQFWYNIEFFKVMINPKQLPTDQKEFISKPVKDEFWKEQDVVAISEAVNSFREIIKL